MQLRSFSSDLMCVPKVNTNIGTMAVSATAAILCIMLPSGVTSVENIANLIPLSFKK